MSAVPYTVDNEKYHESIFTRVRLAEKGLLGLDSIQPMDGLTKRAAQAYAEHLKMPPKRRPRFPSVVTSDTLFRYRVELLRRGILPK